MVQAVGRLERAATIGARADVSAHRHHPVRLVTQRGGALERGVELALAGPLGERADRDFDLVDHAFDFGAGFHSGLSVSRAITVASFSASLRTSLAKRRTSSMRVDSGCAAHAGHAGVRERRSRRHRRPARATVRHR